MGIGFNVDKDIPLLSRMTNITLTNNVDNTSDADGTIITGLYFQYLYPGLNTGPNYLLENVTVRNCQLGYIYSSSASTHSPLDNLEVRDCYITTSVGGYSMYMSDKLSNSVIRNNLMLNGIGLLYSSSAASNIISNNIIYGSIYVNVAGSNTTILNNNFMASSGGDHAFNSKFQDCLVTNNIFYGITPSFLNGGGSTSTEFQRNNFTNNLVYSTGDDTMPPSGGGSGNSGSGNITGQSPLFTNAQLLNTWSTDYDFTLQGGSPAIDAGSDGTDIGISGGSYPFTDANFVLKTTHAPVIQILNTGTVINPGDDLPVRIKANSN